MNKSTTNVTPRLAGETISLANWRQKGYDEAVRSLDHQDRRPKMNFSRVVSTEHTRLVTDAYPEFSISFTAKTAYTRDGPERLLL